MPSTATLSTLGAAPGGRAPLVRPAYRLLSRAHASVTGLLDTVTELDAGRRARNLSPRGRRAEHEVDILRAAIVFTSAGLDASMRRLVNDAGRRLVLDCPLSGARSQFEEFVKDQLSRPQPAATFRDAVVSLDSDRLVSLYMAEKTRASYQRSADLKSRVRNLLGIPKSSVPDTDIERLDAFFVSRNQIVHDMDLQDPASARLTRTHRTSQAVADECGAVFDLAVTFIWQAARQCSRQGI